jgi:subtilisin family serine protease
MRRPTIYLAAVCLFLLVIGTSRFGSASPDPQSPLPPHVPGQVVVGFRPTSSVLDRALVHASVDAVVLDRIPRLGIELVTSRGGEPIEALMQRYSANPFVRFAEPNYLMGVKVAPNDPSYSAQWSLNNTGQDGGIAGADIKAPQAWDIQTGSASITVAVLDTGVNYSHPDLQANIWTNPFDDCGGLTDDGDIYNNDCRGWNFVAGTNDPNDDNGHGTHVAGIIGAVGNNSAGISGVAWSVRILPVKVFPSGGVFGQSFQIAQGMDYAVVKGAKIINYSAGDTIESQGITTAIGDARDHGVLLVSAAGSFLGGGHDENVTHFYPCNSDVDNIICVTSTNQSDQRDFLADWGSTTVDLGAPGEHILSTAININFCKDEYSGGYARCNGTSMATPHVSGVAALMLSQYPTLTYAKIKSAILGSVDIVDSLKQITVSGGRLNAFRAVQSANDTIPPSAPTNLAATAAGTATVNLSWTASTDNVFLHHYQVFRSPRKNTPYQAIGISTTTSFSDNSPAANTTYLYRIRAFDGAGNPSSDSALDIATTFVFTDSNPPLAAGALVRAVHITDLRTAVDKVRYAANLEPPFQWTDTPLNPGAPIRAIHVTELRTKVDDARTQLGISVPAYSESITAGQTVIKAIHVNELRGRTQ